jgi:hypothetical protein
MNAEQDLNVADLNEQLQQLRDELFVLDRRRLEVVAEIQNIHKYRIKSDVNPKMEGAIDSRPGKNIVALCPDQLKTPVR